MIPDNWKYTIISKTHDSNEFSNENYYFYFDENGILRKLFTAGTRIVSSGSGNYGGTIFLCKRMVIEDDLKILFNNYNIQSISSILLSYISQYATVDSTTYDDFIAYAQKWREKSVKNEKYHHKDDNMCVERFITRIGKPKFEKNNDNKDAREYSTIKLEMYIIHDWPNKKEYLRNNFTDIKSLAINKLKSSAWFNKFGLNITSYKISSVKVTSQDILEMTFKKVG